MTEEEKKTPAKEAEVIKFTEEPPEESLPAEVIRFPANAEPEAEAVSDGPMLYMVYVEGYEEPQIVEDHRDYQKLLKALFDAKQSKKGPGFFTTDTGAWHAQDVRGLKVVLPADLDDDEGEDDDEDMALPEGISFDHRGPA